MLGPAAGNVTVPGGKALYLIVTPEGASRLDCLAQLKPDDLYRIRMHDVPVSAATFKQIAKLNGLRELDVSKSDTNDSNLRVITEIKSLRRLDLQETLVRGPGFSAFRKLPDLRDLDLAANLIEDSYVSTLVAAIPAVEKLNLSKTRITDKSLKQLSTLNKLKKLKLTGTLVTKKGIAALNAVLPNCQIKY